MGLVAVTILLALLVGLAILLPGSKKVRRTHAYTCGVTELDQDTINVSAQNMYETPVSLVRKLHKAIIVPLFGNGEEAEK